MLNAKQLKISQDEYDGLVFLKSLFEDEARRPKGVVTDHDCYRGFHVPYYSDQDKLARGPLGFSMQLGGGVPDDGAAIVQGCGSAACIGGHLYLHMQGHDVTGRLFPGSALVAANRYVMEREPHKTFDNRPIGLLFFPVDIEGSWAKITPAHAAQAIENFLTEGQPKWEEVTGFPTRYVD